MYVYHVTPLTRPHVSEKDAMHGGWLTLLQTVQRGRRVYLAIVFPLFGGVEKVATTFVHVTPQVWVCVIVNGRMLKKRYPVPAAQMILLCATLFLLGR